MRAGARVALAVALAVCAVGGGVSALLLTKVWQGYFEYRSPHLAQAVAPSVAGEPVAKLTVLIVVDGLRVQDHARLHSVRAMESYGSGGVVSVPPPTLTAAGWRTIFTGASPSVAGLSSQSAAEASSLPETILETARRQGRPAVFVGDRALADMLGAADVCVSVHAGVSAREMATARYVDDLLGSVKKHNPALAVMHTGVLERVAREHGTQSADYAEALAQLDAQIGRVVEQLQAPDTAFVVVSSGGQLQHGQRGGPESEIASAPCTLAGPGIRLSAVEGGLDQVASSVAVLSGIPAPRHAISPPLDVFAPDKARQGIVRAEKARRVFAKAYAKTVGRITVSEETTAAAGVTDPLSGAGIASVERERLSSDRKGRFGYALAGLGLLAIPLAVGLLSWRLLVAGLAGLLVQFAAFNVVYFGLHGYLWSLSSIGGSWDRIWITTRVLEGALSAVIGMFAALLILRSIAARGGDSQERQRELRWLVGPVTSLLGLTAVLMQIAVFAWWWNVGPSWLLPDPGWWFKTAVDALQGCGIALGAFVWLAVARIGDDGGVRDRRM